MTNEQLTEKQVCYDSLAVSSEFECVRSLTFSSTIKFLITIRNWFVECAKITFQSQPVFFLTANYLSTRNCR